MNTLTWGGVALVLAVLIAWPFAVDSRYILHVGVLVTLSISLALSLNMMLRIGQLSAAQAAFMGLGAYTSALLTMRGGLPFSVSFVAAGLLVGAVAAILGPIFLRVKGVYFVLLTFATGQAIVLMFQEWVGLFGGNNGIFGIPKAMLWGKQISGPREYYYFSLALAILAFLTTTMMFASRSGQILRSIGEDDVLSQSLGLDASRYRVAVFVVSGLFAGWTGSLYAHYTSFLSPEAFGFWTFVDVLVINVVGGVFWPLGPVLGAILLIPLPEFLRDAKQYQMLAYGGLLLLFVLFMPAGIIGELRKFLPEPKR